MFPRWTLRNVSCSLLGAVALVLKSAYRGPLRETVYAHGGNVFVSFALYFVAVNATAKLPYGRLLAASGTLLAVEAFEATDGFGIMANTYDPLDFVANALGVALAVVVDLLSSRWLRHRHPAAGKG